MQTINKLYQLASMMDEIGYHKEADEITNIAMSKFSQSAPLPLSGGQMYGLGDIAGILTGLVGKSIAPYAGQSLLKLISGNTALKETFDKYMQALDNEKNKIRSLYNQDRAPMEQSTSIRTAHPGDITTGKSPTYEIGGQREYDVSRSMWDQIENPSVAETGLKSFLGQLLAQMGYSTNMGSQGLQQGVSNLSYPGARAGDVHKYMIEPLQNR